MRYKWFLILIFSVAFTLRVWALNFAPSGFTPDEASYGYDAYSILKTGRDQWGHRFPVLFESFGDYKMPLYTYLTVPSVAIFGLNKYAVRLPNALVSTLSVAVTYFLIKELFRLKERSNLKKLKKTSFPDFDPDTMAVVCSIFVAINPWHIMMGRGAFEANLTALFMPLGILLFLKGINKNRFFIASGIIFGLNLFTYHSARLVTPLVLMSLIIIYRKEILKNTRSLIKLIIPFGLFLILAVYTLFNGAAARAKDITIFQGALNQASESRFTDIYQGISEPVARLFNNKFQVIGLRFFTNYSQYFSSDFLFTRGPAEGTYGMIPGRGVLYFYELPLLIFSFYAFIKSKYKRSFAILFVWLILAPIPAALTTGKGFAANRSLIMQPALSILSAAGFYTLYRVLKVMLPAFLEKVLLTGFLAVMIFSFISFTKDYFIVSPYRNAKDMLYGNLEVAGWLAKNTDMKKEIIVSRSLSEPHIYIAFANKWDPSELQKESLSWNEYKIQGLKFLDQLGQYKLGKYTFKSIEYKSYQNRKDVLLVGKDSEFPPEARRIMTYIYPDGSPAVVVVEPYNEAYAANILSY